MSITVQNTINAAKDWRVWLNGLIGAAVGGGANAITIMIMKPEEFNFDSGFPALWKFAAISALVSAALYLKEHTVPLAVQSPAPPAPLSS